MSSPCAAIGSPCLLYVLLFPICAARPSFYMTAPTFLQPGVNTTLSVHCFATNYSTINVTANISVAGTSQLLVFAHKIFTNDSVGLLTLPALPPDLERTKLVLAVKGFAQDLLLFSKATPIGLQSSGPTALLEIDRSLYRPRQAVKIRAICLRSDLRPFYGKVDIYIRDPSQNLVQQWLGLQTSLGTVSQEFQLSDAPLFGDWTIDLRTQGFQITKTFTVADYVVPKFLLIVATPPIYITEKEENVTIQVTAKYGYGEPVSGNATVSISPSWWYTRQSINKTHAISGTFNFSFSYAELQSAGIVFSPRDTRKAISSALNLHWGSANITVTVKESLTGFEVVKKQSLFYTNTEYLILDDGKQFKRHLNNTIRIKVLRSDLLPLTKADREKNVSVLITQSIGLSKRSLELPDFSSTLSPMEGAHFQQYVLPENGELTLNVKLPESSSYVAIEVSYQNATHNIWKNIMWQEPDAYIQILKPSSSIQVGAPFQVFVQSSEHVKELNYVVLSRGQVVAAGKKYTEDFVLTPDVSWAPQAVINVYYIHNRNYVIFDSMTFSVKGGFKNKVSLAWSKTQAKPAENVSLSVTVEEPGSLVGLRVVEKGADETRIDETQVENELLAFQGNRGQSITDINEQYYEYYEQQMDVDWSNIHGNAFADQSVGNPFSETWIWMESNISSGKNTNLQVTVPKSITTWVASAFVISEGRGFAVTSEPVELQVFQQFYISVNLPYSVTRGEEFILEVVIYNQLEQTLEVTVTLEQMDSFEIVGPSHAGMAPNQRKSTVPSNSGQLVLFPIKPKQLGEMTFNIKATSLAASDATTKVVLVKPEGIQQFYSQSILLQLAGSTPQTVTKGLTFVFPNNVVSGSVQAYVTAVGDILGPTIDGLESLIQMPYGCGEQNMINFCPNIYILQYLNATGQTTPSITEKSINYMNNGYQRQLTYKRDDGSFSAFGNSDSSGSTWLSAFVLRCFLQARPFIFIDQTVLEITIRWLIGFQKMDTGEFTEPGRVIHTELQGGQSGPITLTSYILTALLEDPVYRVTYGNEAAKAIQFLESKFQEGISSNYTLAVVTYALSLANSTKAGLALDQLNGRAERTDGGMFWYSPAAGINNYWQPRSSEIEMAAYALLSCGQLNRINEGISIMKWLSQQRSRLGGYSSTQDTIMALQALSQFAAVYSSNSASMAITVTGPGDFVPKSFQISSVNRLVQQRAQISVRQPLSINISAVGNGVAVFQLNVVYNTMLSARRRRSLDGTETFALNITVEDDKNNLNRLTVHACTSYIPSKYANESGMALMQVDYLSGFSLDPSVSIQNDLLKKVEPEDGKVNLYFDTISGAPVCVRVPMLRNAKVSGSQDAMISMVDYYKPSSQVIRPYSSSVMKAISSCTFCGKDCSLCGSNVNAIANANASPALVVHFASYVVVLTCLTHAYF
ncbi:CD109 antigen-like [Ambystoma mexicanum]|uniref:CD109 antigen-like n=1 Tax=Ambystoma mexicanum TaxID=8296 RepID=UPI0037E98036